VVAKSFGMWWFGWRGCVDSLIGDIMAHLYGIRLLIYRGCGGSVVGDVEAQLKRMYNSDSVLWA
jgi:hypothetical protein